MGFCAAGAARWQIFAPTVNAFVVDASQMQHKTMEVPSAYIHMSAHTYTHTHTSGRLR